MPDGKTFVSRGTAYELSQDEGIARPTAEPLDDIIDRRFGRRDMMRGALAATAVAAVSGPAILARSRPAAAQSSSFDFEELQAGSDAQMHVAPGYDAKVLIRWGDPVVKGAPAFDPENQTAAAQEQQFGYNNDYIGYFPLPLGSDSSDHGLLAVNHEYTNEELMFPGVGRQDGDAEFGAMTQELVDIELAAHGMSVIEVRRGADGWEVVPDSDYGRRLTMLSTPMAVGGPAAGSDRLKTGADPDGSTVIGTINNCAGGMTPWGTVLTGEENFHGYFWGEVAEGGAEAANHDRYGVPGGWYNWGAFHDRFDVSKEPNEPNRFGWVVEFDPYDPNSTPVKRTAMGRFKHEGAATIVNGDGRVVAYLGDDERFEYLYKFVTSGSYNPDDRAANADLLDEGTLSVAIFNEDGTVTWAPLVHGQGPLTAENGFESQADVVIEARRAADLLGATPMDRPEDVEPNPVTGKVYVMLTNNTRRKPEQVNAANPRPESAFGHIVEITPIDGDHAAETSNWTILVKCGPPDAEGVGADWNPATTDDGWFGMPDNCAIDHRGRLWISTDGNSEEDTGRTDGVWAMETDGELRGTGKHFFRVPVGAEMCGPMFTPDDSTLFLAVQHPADGSTYDDPSTRWPDFDDSLPPRPSIVAVTKTGGGPIG